MNQSFYIMLASAMQTKAPESALVLRVNTLCNSLEAGSGEFHKVAWSLTAFLPNARSCETAGTKRSSTQCIALPAASHLRRRGTNPTQFTEALVADLYRR